MAASIVSAQVSFQGQKGAESEVPPKQVLTSSSVPLTGELQGPIILTLVVPQ